MTNLTKLKSMTQEELVNWLDKYGDFDGSPWMKWFGKTYCDNCPGITCKVPAFDNKEVECSFCELNHKCKFFEELERELDTKDILKLWLESNYQSEAFE